MILKDRTRTGHADLAQRIRAEYLEMPGLRLSADQARRLWGTDEETCRTALTALVDTRFLQQLYDGTFVRR